jgi:hypothetical protein
MSIDEIGFLSPDVASHEKVLRLRYAEYFSLCDRSIRLCHRLKFGLTVHNRDGQEIFAAGLFLKLLADAEGALILLMHGMPSQTHSLLRVAVECLIILAKVCESYEFVEALGIVAESERLKLINGIKHNNHPGFETVRKELTDELVEEIKRRIEGKPKGVLRNWAVEVGLADTYDCQYRLFSPDVHSGPVSLEPLFVYGKDELITEFRPGPNLEYDYRTDLLEVSRVLLTGAAYVGKLFAVEVDPEKPILRIEHDRLGKKALEEACSKTVDSSL